jgi:hypothetical protein
MSSTSLPAEEMATNERWQKDLDWCRRRSARLTQWEEQFLRELGRPGADPSLKQIEVLSGIVRKLARPRRHRA